MHDGPLDGHLGIIRTEERVKKRFHWPGILKTVTKHIELCHVCNQKNSSINRNTAPLGHISLSQRFTFWARDYMGPLPETSRATNIFLFLWIISPSGVRRLQPLTKNPVQLHYF